MKKFTANDHSVKGVEHGDSIEWDRGEIEENWKFNGQLRIKLHNSKTNDQNKKRRWNLGLALKFGRVKLHKMESLKSIRGAIERN